jgi:hypothetical protein
MKGRTLSNQKAGVKKMQAGGVSAIKGRPGGAYEALQAKFAASRAREEAFRKANSVEARAAAQRAARAARNAPPTPPMSPPPPPMAAPAGRMSNMAMVKKGGMLKAKKR